MKILIISSPRSGSSSLLNAIYKSIDKCKGFAEPFNKVREEGFGDPISEYSLDYSKLVVKILSWDLLPFENFDEKNLIFQNSILHADDINFITPILNYSKNFNKIILLSRKSQMQAAKSLLSSILNNSFHTKYNYSSSLDPKLMERSLQIIKNNNSIIEVLGKYLKLPINYYENIYNKDKDSLKNFLISNNIKIDNFNTFKSYLDLKNRYRQN